ncbi:MAG TPA: CRTAC1 family protein [Bryobacteraceae bacterium]|nr:CRTAC1 family protein [Bryobacteraceae bacterium]
MVLPFTRRAILKAALAAPLLGQGMATRNVRPRQRAKRSGLPFDAKFTDIARQAGLTAPTIYGNVDTKKHILEAVGCGIAFFDFDHDGWLDILVLGGTRFGATPPGAGNRLYKNNRDGTFSDVTSKSGLARPGWVSGVAIGDYNNDGIDDLFLTYYDRNVLFRNNGDGTFTDVTHEAGVVLDGPQWSTGCTFVDYDRDGNLDLFFNTYVDLDTGAKIPAGCDWKGIAVHCGPRGLPMGRCYLFHNDGHGRFTDVSKQAGVDRARAYGFTAVAADFDNDGWPDIYVACDSTPSLYFRNRNDGTFVEEGLERGVALSEDGAEQAGMGIGIGDYRLDGTLGILKTHFADDTSVLYENNGKGEFTDVTLKSGLGVETRFVCWGAGIVDLDNDGWSDLFIAAGQVFPELERQAPFPYKNPRIVFRNLGAGKFEELFDEAGPAIAAPHSSRGCAFGDFDNDGDIDIVIMNMNEPPSLLRNDSSGRNHWLKVQLEATSSNRSAIGARVTAHYGGRTQVQEVMSQSSFLSVNDKRLHFGLGAETGASLEVRWPNGMKEAFSNVAVNRLVVIREGAGVVRSLKPPFTA